MLQLCEIIDTGGYVHCEENPGLKVIFFGELFDVRLMEVCGHTFIYLVYDYFSLSINRFTHQ